MSSAIQRQYYRNDQLREEGPLRKGRRHGIVRTWHKNGVSNGDPIAIAAGAAGCVLVSEGLHYAARKQADKAYATGYDKGKSDAVKQQYWLYVSMQKHRNQVGNVRLYPVQLPEQRIDGGNLPTHHQIPPH